MTTINADLYEALITAKVPKEKARAAAETDKEKTREEAKETTRAAGKVDMLVRTFFLAMVLIAGVIGGLAYVTFDLGNDVARVDAKLTNVETKVTDMEITLDDVETQIAEVKTQMAVLETRTTNIELKLDNMGQDLAEIKAFLLESR